MQTLLIEVDDLSHKSKKAIVGKPIAIQFFFFFSAQQQRGQNFFRHALEFLFTLFQRRRE